MNTVLETLILAAATIAGSVLTWILNSLLQKAKYQSIPKNRKRALFKDWHGHYQLIGDLNNTSLEMPQVKIQISFSGKWRKIIGVGQYLFKEEPTKVTYDGYLKNDSVIVLSYKNSDQSKFHFGNLILSLNANADSLTGYFIAFGRTSDGPVVGRIELKTK